MQKRSTDDFACFLCDYAVYLLAVLIVLVLFLYFHTGIPALGPPPALPPAGEQGGMPQQPQSPHISTRIANASTLVPVQPTVTYVGFSEYTATPMMSTTQTPFPTRTLAIATKTNISPTTTIAPTPSGPPEYVLAFVPVQWKGTRQEFIDAANRQGDFFVQASGLKDYFNVKYVFFEQTFSDGKLTDSDLLDKMLIWAIQREPADRYIGLADGDLAPDNNTWVAGYTFGIDTQGVLAEITEDTIAAHELGHTYGLCDEYNFNAWDEQNQSLSDGCPNPYPSHCPKNTGVVNECDGTSSNDGKMSLMASSGPSDQSAYNETCQEHLAEVFQHLAQKAR